MATVLLSGGARYYFDGGTPPIRQDGLQIAQRGGALDQCLDAVQLEFDVHWAAACTTQVGGDDSADCDLPDVKAAVVNAWLTAAERQCMAEARASR